MSKTCHICGRTLNAEGACPATAQWISLSQKKRVDAMHAAQAKHKTQE